MWGNVSIKFILLENRNTVINLRESRKDKEREGGVWKGREMMKEKRSWGTDWNGKSPTEGR